MKKYKCPYCNGLLDVKDSIVFITKNAQGIKGILLLSKEVGDYTYACNPDYKFEIGDKFEFYCPLCNTNLKCKEKNAMLARVILVDDDNEEYEILFSSIAGEHCTYKISKHNTIESFGPHASRYLDFENLIANK